MQNKNSKLPPNQDAVSEPLGALLSSLTRNDDISSPEDIQVLEELKNEVATTDLEAFILSRRQQEIQRQVQGLAVKKKTDRPFEHFELSRLLLLDNHWHKVVAACAHEELARRELICFTKQTYPGYTANWHHIEYAKKLDAFARGEIQNLMVFMPPQHGKSELCSRRMPAKLLGNNPDTRIAVVSYNHPFASKFNRDIQRIIDSEEYRVLFPDTRLNSTNIRTVAGAYVRNADEFEIVGCRGSLVSVGVCGGLTGRPVDVLIIDDPYKSQKEAWSPTVRRSIQDWYDTVALTRLHNKSQQLITLTRWHPDDLAGCILRSEPEKWEVVKFPAVKEGPPLPYDPRQPGDALWPEVHSLERMEAVKKRNAFVFQAMYQQDPKPAEGLLFPPDTLHYFSAAEIIGMEFDTIVAVSDVADRGSDYYCMPIAGVKGERIYFLDVIFTQEPVKVTIPLTLSKLVEWRPARHRIESNNGGSIFAHTIREQNTTATTIDEKATSTNKETRILMASGQVQEYCWFREDYLPGSQYEAFMASLTSYMLAGGNEHDDAPDATTMIVELVHPAKATVTLAVLGDDADVPTKNKSLFQRLIGRLTDTRSNNWF